MEVLAYLLISAVAVSCQKTHSVPCTSSSDCQKEIGLYCVPSEQSSEKFCQCPTNETVFDFAQGRCVGKIGFNCIQKGEKSYCPQNARCNHQDPHHVSLYYIEPRCFCELGFAGNDNGTCSSTAGFGDSCSSAKKCDEQLRIKCVSGKCACEFGAEQFYDAKRGKCISYAGANCTDYYACVDNARCDGVQATRARAVLPKSAGQDVVTIGAAGTPTTVQTVGKCLCEFGFTSTSQRTCLGGFRQACSLSQPCNAEDDLDCQDGSCTCKHPLHMFYDYNLKKCVKLVGATCDSTSGPKCVEHAQCSSNRICKCVKGYSKTPYRRCMLDVGEACENEKCNIHAGLTCKMGQCKCMDDTLTYDVSLRACVNRVGLPCGKIGQVGDYGKEPFYISCEPGAVCRQEPNGDANTHFCRNSTHTD